MTRSTRRIRRPGAGGRPAARSRARLALLWAIVLLTAGCATGTGDGDRPTRCTGVGVTADEVRLGLVTSDTGSSSTLFRNARGGMEARLAVTNAQGGVHGRKIVYEWRDDASEAASNLVAARDLVEKAGVLTVEMATSVAAGSAEYLHQQGVPVTGTGIEHAWARYDNMTSYSYMVAEGQVNDSWGQFARSQGARRAVLLESIFSATSRQVGEGVAASLTRAGVEIVDTIDVTTHGNDPVSMLNRIRESGADTLASAVPTDTFAAIYVNAKRVGAPLKLGLSPNGYDRDLLTRYGAELRGLYFAVDIMPFEQPTPAHARYLAAMSKYAPYVSEPREQVALASWIYADISIRALEAAGPCPTRQAILDAIRAMHSYDAGGLLPAPVDLGRHPGEVTRCYSFVRVNEAGTDFEVASRVPYCGDAAPPE